MTQNQRCPWMFGQQSIASCQQLLIGGDVLTVKIEPLEIRCALLVRPLRFPARRIVCDMYIYGQLQLCALSPELIQTTIVEVQPLAAWQVALASPPESPTLVREFADAACALLITANKLTHGPSGIVRSIGMCAI